MFRNGNFRGFDDDPFFSDPFQAHRDHMRQMMRSFSEPLGGPFMPSITDGRNRGHDTVEPPALRSEHRDATTNPFSMFDNIMTNMRSKMEGMCKNFENMSTDANTHSFSSSSVMTYSKVGNEPPKVFQVSSSTRRAPGDVKETVKALKDSESGLEKMSIGHHIQDRGHVVEKKMNKKTGDKEFIQDFQNMDESEAQSFDEEWQKELSKFKPSGSMAQLEPPRRHRGQQAPLAGPERTHREQPKSKPKSILKVSNSTKQ
ncbi:myeloid leukemia factor 1 isoform X1 [Phyllopteryx taeniolatus]|uniref:myeloid leukemia factor 1 isoform X1 n=1 Tax=Phyllopteryx taeniolatus TaxID=161469 RepID=UPI002AD56353|nr:myeloid leukemia factor 1 isoform X1 [Phyllopteryx taeniolatus]